MAGNNTQYPPNCSPESDCVKKYNDICKGLQSGSITSELTTIWNGNQLLEAYDFTVCVLNIWFASVIFRNK